MICKTVKVLAGNEKGFMIINESDFDEDEHKLFIGKELKVGSVEWLKLELKSIDVEIPDGAKKSELLSLLDAKLAE